MIWFVVNNTLVSGVAADEGQSFWQEFSEDIGYYVVTTAAVLALSPLIVLAAMSSPWYVPLLLIPMFAVHKTAHMSLVEQHKALHDPLTGLPNRKYLLQRLDEAVQRPDITRFSVALLDLDRFKEVNDTLGHHVGDRLLEMVAQRIQGVLRGEDLVARLGGDEFAVVMPQLANDREAADVSRRVRDALVEPFQLEEVLLELEASIGIALYPEHGTDVEQLMRRADVAMYLAKEQHTGVEVYDPARDRNSTDRLGLLAALRRALDDGELDLHYQPKVTIGDVGHATAHVVGVEALLRWNHPTRGFIPPDEFIPLAETSGLMHRLTEFVIDTALAQVAQWRAEGLAVAVAVNVSARDLHGSELARTVSEALARHRVPAPLLKLELDRAHPDGRAHPGHGHADRPRGTRRGAQPGRLRHRLLVDVHAQAPAGERDQGRPLVRQQARRARRGRLDRALDHRPRPRARAAGGRGGRRDRRGLVAAAGPGLRRGAGLAGRPPDAGRCRDRVVARARRRRDAGAPAPGGASGGRPRRLRRRVQEPQPDRTCVRVWT